MRHIITIVLCLSLLSCGTITRLINSTHKKEQSKSDSTSNVKKDSSGQSKTVIQEKLDTSKMLKADTAKGHSTLDSLKSNDIRVDNGHTIIDVHYNDTTGKITATAISKARKVHFKVDKTTTTQATFTVTTNATDEVKKSSKINDTSKSVSVKKTGISIPWWVWLIVALALLTGAYFLYRKFSFV